MRNVTTNPLFRDRGSSMHLSEAGSCIIWVPTRAWVLYLFSGRMLLGSCMTVMENGDVYYGKARLDRSPC